MCDYRARHTVLNTIVVIMVKMFPMAVEYSLFGRKLGAYVVNVFFFLCDMKCVNLWIKKSFGLIYETLALSTRILQ